MTAPAPSVDREEPSTGPIRSATAGLVRWLSSATGSTPTVQLPSDKEADKDLLVVWPLGLATAQQLHGSIGRAPYRFTVRHLVTGPPALLEAALVAAVRAGEPAISLDPLQESTWLALRAQPRIALIVNTDAQIDMPVAAASLVRHPLRVTGGSLTAITGRVLTPEDVPLAGVRIELVGTGGRTYTDSSGGFAFNAVPAGQDPVRLHLFVKGHRMAVSVTAADDVIIHCDL